MPLSWRARTIAVVLAIALHVALSISIYRPGDWSSAVDAGIGGIEIALGPEGGTSGETEPQVEEPAPEPEPEEAPVEEPLETPPEIETPPQPFPEPVVALDAEPVMAIPDPVVDVQPSPASVEPEGNEGTGGTLDSPVVGTANASTSAGGSPGAEASYASVVLAWLEKHKQYPRISRRRREEGVILLFIAIDADGHVLEVRLEEPSRFDRLNDAALDMVERANPLPPIPADMAQSRLELLVPVQFFMNRR